MASYKPDMPITIPNPCEKKRWEDLPGGARARFCDGCQREVHNLAAMTPKQIELLLAGPFAESNPVPCVRMVPDEDGSMLVAEERRQPMRFAQIAAAAMSTAAMATVAGCKSHPAPVGTAVRSAAASSAQSASSQARASGATSVTGRLLDEAGRPMKDVAVMLMVRPTYGDHPPDADGLAMKAWEDRHTVDRVQTDGSGRFGLKAEQGGEYLLLSVGTCQPGDRDSAHKYVSAHGGEVDLGDVRCVPPPVPPIADPPPRFIMGTPLPPSPPPPKISYPMGLPKRIEVPPPPPVIMGTPLPPPRPPTPEPPPPKPNF